MPMESCPLLASPLFAELGASVKPSDVRYLHDLFLRVRSYQVDQGEYACLKALVLFRPGTVVILERAAFGTLCNMIRHFP